jgi:Ser/Thr protein kinase RdoA (MazF antagonist)
VFLGPEKSLRPAKSMSGCVISIRDIQAIVRQYPPNFQPTRIEALGAAGGMSGAQFWRIESGAGPLILRQWPTEHPSPERLRFIHDVLFHAAAHGVSFVPAPIRSAGGDSFVQASSHLWQLEPLMPGEPAYERSPNPQKLRAAMMALAQFHVATSDFPTVQPSRSTVTAPAIAKRLTRLNELGVKGAGHLCGAITPHILPPLEPLAHQFLATLPYVIPDVTRQLESLTRNCFPTQPCIRDIWHDHVLFTDNEVTGIIDFGGMDIDTPTTDIARLLGSLVADDDKNWQIGIDAYSSVKPLSATEAQTAKALDHSGTILAGCNWLQWIYVDRRQFERPAQIIERFRRIVERCNFAAMQ